VLDGRKLFITNFLGRDQDFTQTIRGGLISIVLEGLFVNPGNEKPINVEHQIQIFDYSD
jgi:hypothetical protein